MKISDDEFERMMNEADTNHDGQISKDGKENKLCISFRFCNSLFFFQNFFWFTKSGWLSAYLKNRNCLCWWIFVCYLLMYVFYWLNFIIFNTTFSIFNLLWVAKYSNKTNVTVLDIYKPWEIFCQFVQQHLNVYNQPSACE